MGYPSIYMGLVFFDLASLGTSCDLLTLSLSFVNWLPTQRFCNEQKWVLTTICPRFMEIIELQNEESGLLTSKIDFIAGQETETWEFCFRGA